MYKNSNEEEANGDRKLADAKSENSKKILYSDEGHGMLRNACHHFSSISRSNECFLGQSKFLILPIVSDESLEEIDYVGSNKTYVKDDHDLYKKVISI